MLGDNCENDLNSCFRVDYDSGKYALRKEGFNWVLLIGREKQNPQKKKTTTTPLSSNGGKGT